MAPVEGAELKSMLFERTYVGTSAIPLLMEHVNGCSEAFKNGKVHSPYFAIVQSSGTGKTKLVMEAARQERMVSLFLLCRKTQGSHVSPFIRELQGYVSRHIQHLDIRLLETFIEQRLWTAVCKLLAMENLVDRLIMSRPYRDAEVATPFEETEEGRQRAFWRDGVTSSVVAPPTTIPSRIPLVLVLDEAKHLNTWWVDQLSKARNVAFAYDSKLLLKALRRVVMTIHRRLGDRRFAMIVMDTSSAVANFLPTAREDPTAVHDPALTTELWPPFLSMDTFDLTLRTREEELGRGMTPQATAVVIPALPARYITERGESAEEVLRMFSLGRPLWKSKLESRPINSMLAPREKCEAMVDFVLERYNPNAGHQALSLSSHLAPIAARVPLRFGGLNAIASLMVSRYLGILYHCSEDREHTKVLFREEPLVGAAYSHLLQQVPNAAKRSLDALIKFLVEASGEVGFFGEFAVQLLLTAAMDSVSQGMPYVPVRMDAFLSAFLGSSVTVALPKAFAEARVAFCQFVRLNSQTITAQHIRAAQVFCHGIVPVSNNRGFDLLIVYECSETGQVGFLLVEVKNQAANQAYSEAFKGMRERLGEARALGHEAVGLIAIMGQGEEALRKVHILFGDDPAQDLSFSLSFSPSNSWGQVQLMTQALNLALSSLKVSPDSFSPQISGVEVPYAPRVRESFASILRFFTSAPGEEVIFRQARCTAPSGPRGGAPPSGGAGPSLPPPPPPPPSGPSRPQAPPSQEQQPSPAASGSKRSAPPSSQRSPKGKKPAVSGRVTRSHSKK